MALANHERRRASASSGRSRIAVAMFMRVTRHEVMVIASQVINTPRQ